MIIINISGFRRHIDIHIRISYIDIDSIHILNKH